MTSLRIGGVPEHFNLPWHLVLESALPAQLGIDARWQDFPDGSGAMAAALRAGRLDAAMLLTEGAVAGIAAGGGFEVVSLYTESPLLWGIHVPAASRFASVADIRGARYAISRRGSGSHLMAFVHAREQGWPLDALELVIVGNLQGAIDAFAAGSADVFFWEKFMTKPVVDAGRFRRVGDFVAPWPAFVVCASAAATMQQRAALATLLPHVLTAAARLAGSGDGAARIAARYELDRDDVAEWLRGTRWAGRPGIDRGTVASVIGALHAAGLVARDLDVARVIGSL
jgi:ABC-type nitrate/sulfonate/bicarbonate transport system substrate-binding protein